MRRIIIVGSLAATALLGGGFTAAAQASAPASKPAVAPVVTELDECGEVGETKISNPGPAARKAPTKSEETCSGDFGSTGGGTVGPTKPGDVGVVKIGEADAIPVYAAPTKR